MVCSWLANSWVCARRVSLVARLLPSSRSSAESSVRSRSVVTEPITEPRERIGRRFSASTRSPTEQQPVRSRLAAAEHVDDLQVELHLLEPSPDRVRWAAEQVPGAVVDDGHPAVAVQGHHALLDAVHQGLAVLDQPGDLGRLHAQRLALDPAGEQQRAAQAQDAGHPEVDEQVGYDVAQPRPHRGDLTLDRRDADHLARGGRRPGTWATTTVLPASLLRPGPGGARRARGRCRVRPCARPGRGRRRPARRGRSRSAGHPWSPRRCGPTPPPTPGPSCPPGRAVSDALPDQRVGGEVLGRAARGPQLLALEGARRLGDRDGTDRDEHGEHDQHLEQEELPREGHAAPSHPLRIAPVRPRYDRDHNDHNVLCDRNGDARSRQPVSVPVTSSLTQRGPPCVASAILSPPRRLAVGALGLALPSRSLTACGGVTSDARTPPTAASRSPTCGSWSPTPRAAATTSPPVRRPRCSRTRRSPPAPRSSTSRAPAAPWAWPARSTRRATATSPCSWASASSARRTPTSPSPR